MVSFLSEEWLAGLAAAGGALTELPGVDGTVRFDVSGTAHGKVRARLVVVDGRLAAVESGSASDPGEADTVVSGKVDDVAAWFRGDLDGDLAYMTGRLKFEDDYPCFVYRLRPVFTGSAWRTAVDGLLADTDFA